MDDMQAARTAADEVLRGFDRLPCPGRGERHAAPFWRLGRWLRATGAGRPRSLRVIGEATIIADGRILKIDEFGDVRDLSTTRRDQGTRLASLSSWGRRR